MLFRVKKHKKAKILSGLLKKNMVNKISGLQAKFASPSATPVQATKFNEKST